MGISDGAMQYITSIIISVPAGCGVILLIHQQCRAAEMIADSGPGIYLLKKRIPEELPLFVDSFVLIHNNIFSYLTIHRTQARHPHITRPV